MKIDAYVQSQVGDILIGYLIRDTPYELAMDNYVINVWNLVMKPQVILDT